MKLFFKERLFSWFDSYDIFDENENVVFKVKGVLAWGHCLKIYDQYENYIGMVKEEVLTFLPRFKMYEGENVIGSIKKEFTFFRPKFQLDFNNWVVQGDLMEWNYTVAEGGRTVMQAHKKVWNFTDTYEIDIERQEDMLYSLMIVLAIDAAKCSEQQ